MGPLALALTPVVDLACPRGRELLSTRWAKSVYINSDLIFGLFHVLGYQFSPRLADVGEARFWRIDASADYGVLNGLARQTINHNLITENWDDVLRVAGSLKLGTVNVTELLRALQGNGHPSTLAKAIAEVGRIAKSLYLLSYIDDPAYRRRILIQLNKGESRHSLARATYFGHKGEVRQRYREGQEEQLGALGLVVNAMVLWIMWNRFVKIFQPFFVIEDRNSFIASRTSLLEAS